MVVDIRLDRPFVESGERAMTTRASGSKTVIGQ
jgi:hypothetical protein